LCAAAGGAAALASLDEQAVDALWQQVKRME
jgi:hypothetical protein